MRDDKNFVPGRSHLQARDCTLNRVGSYNREAILRSDSVLMAKRKSCTIYDVAHLARVSVATVSALINSSAFVGPARAERIRDAMAALDYHPDRVARSLRTGKTHAIGMVVPDVTNPFFPQVIRGVEQAAQQAGYSLVLVNSNEDPEQERRGLQTLISMRVDGALIACCDNTTATYDLVSRRKTPAVFLDRVPLGANAIRISTDNFKAGWVSTSIWLIWVTRESPLWRAESNSHPTRIASKVSARQCRKPDCPYWTSISEPIRYHRKPATRLGNNCWNCRSARPRSFAQTTRPSSDWCAP